MAKIQSKPNRNKKDAKSFLEKFNDLNNNLFKPKPAAKPVDLIMFTRQFATMIDAGLPVIEIIDILAEQVTDKAFKPVVSNVRDDIKAGSDLSAALARYPQVFSQLYINMIKAGEVSGDLDIILGRLADYIEKADALKRKIKSAMTYPVISLGLVVAITIFLLIFIIPQFEEIFLSMGITLPLPTRMLLKVSNTLSTHYLTLLGIIAVIVVLAIYSRKTKKGKYLWDFVFLKLPVFGQLFQKVAISRFSRTFSTMMKSGVAIIGSLEIVANTAGNAVVEKAVISAREAVRKGEALATPLSECPVFPPMVVRMINVGEKSGALETLLEKVADFYDQQVNSTVDSLTSLIEPLMIVTMGLLVGGIVLSIFLPILDMQAQIGK